VIAALEQRRAQAHAGMLKALRGDRYLALLDKLIEAAQAPALLEGKADRPATKALPPLVRKDWRALDKKVKALTDQPADQELHTVRILAKRCRYAAEVCTPVLGKQTRKLASAARDLQDYAPGAQRRRRRRALPDWASHTRSTPGAFAAGELVALERAAAHQARSRWPQAWKRVNAVAPGLSQHQGTRPIATVRGPLNLEALAAFASLRVPATTQVAHLAGVGMLSEEFRMPCSVYYRCARRVAGSRFVPRIRVRAKPVVYPRRDGTSAWCARKR